MLQRVLPLILFFTLSLACSPRTRRYVFTESRGQESNYTFFLLTERNEIKFYVKAKHDVFVSLSPKNNTNDPFLEIALKEEIRKGLEYRSMIRINKTLIVAKDYRRANSLNDALYQGFVISWKSDFIEVKKEHQLKGFLTYTSPSPFNFQYFGIRTGSKINGSWFLGDFIENSSLSICTPNCFLLIIIMVIMNLY